MMHDHTLHELHFRWRPWRQLCRCGRRQPLARLTGRTRLNHHRRRRTSLLCARSRPEETYWSARGQEHAKATQYCKCWCRPKLATAGKTIRPPVRNIAKQFHLDSGESWSRNTNILQGSRQTDGTRGTGPKWKLAYCRTCEDWGCWCGPRLSTTVASEGR